MRTPPTAHGMRRRLRPALLAGMLPILALGLLSPAVARAQARIVVLQPDRGPIAGGTAVTIVMEGGAIPDPAQVWFGDWPATEVRRVDPGTLAVVTPRGVAGPLPVRVLDPAAGTATGGAVYTYVPPPHLTRVALATAPAGATEVVLEIEGEHFSATARLLVNGTEVPTTVLGPERLQGRLPASLLFTTGRVELRVTDPVGGGGESVPHFLSVINPPPRLTALEPRLPEAGEAGPMLGVRGQDFQPESQIRIAGQAVETRYRSSEELIVAIPPDVLATPAALSVSVVTPEPGGGTSEALTLPLPLFPPAPEPPAFPGRFVVFTSNRKGGWNHLYVLDRQTGRLDPLEEANSPNASDGYPSISADGRFIAFQSNRRQGQYDVFLFDRRTRTLDLLPELNHPTAFDGFPGLSPDGRFIVFESDRLQGRPKIFLFDRQTRRLSELSQANEATADDGLAAISN